MKIFVQYDESGELTKMLTQCRRGIIRSFNKLPINMQDIITSCTIKAHHDPEVSGAVLVSVKIEIKAASEALQEMYTLEDFLECVCVFQDKEKVSHRKMQTIAEKGFTQSVHTLISERIITFREEVKALLRLREGG